MSSSLVIASWLRVGAICTCGTNRHPALLIVGGATLTGQGTPATLTTAFATWPALSATISSFGTVSPQTASSAFTSTVLGAGGCSMMTMPVMVPTAWTPPCSGTPPTSTNAPPSEIAASTAPVPACLSMSLL